MDSGKVFNDVVRHVGEQSRHTRLCNLRGWCKRNRNCTRSELVRILNFDETALPLDGSGTSAVGRPKAVFYNPNLPLVCKATSKESACTTMITGSNAAGKAIPPHFQFQTSAQSQDTEQCRLEAAAYFRGVWCKFGRKAAKYIGTMGLNEKGGNGRGRIQKILPQLYPAVVPRCLRPTRISCHGQS